MRSGFQKDVDKGLSSPKKFIPSKYFYDQVGDRIFQKIMSLPEYYLSRSEYKIFEEQGVEIAQALPFKSAFDIVELGAGDGSKTKLLLKTLNALGLEFTYRPVDISKAVLEQLKSNIVAFCPEISVDPLAGDYFDILPHLSATDKPKLFLFLGSNVGNFQPAEAEAFIQMISNVMHSGDLLMIGMDLQKRPQLIEKAYNDSQGLTASFNMNLLQRMNKELGANFDLDQFEFYVHYDPVRGFVNSFLVSLEDQEVEILRLNKTYKFRENELIHTELSRKFNEEQIERLAFRTGFFVRKEFMDPDHYFVDSLWEKV